MHKSTRVYLERQMSVLIGEATAAFALAQPILARGGIPESHFQHQVDIFVELVRVSGVLGEVTLLLELGQDAEAAKRLQDELQLLRETDPALFLPAPSPKLCALLQVGAEAAVSDPDAWVSAISSATYAHTDERRHRVLSIRRAMFAAGDPPPDEADVADLLLASRDEAIARMMRTGGGVRPSRR